MKKTSAFLIIAFALLTSVRAEQTKPGASITQRPGAERTTASDEEPQNAVFTGKVTSLDTKAGKLTMKVPDKEIQLIADSPSTKAAVAKLKVGDTARVFSRDGKVIAISPVKAETRNKSAKE